MTTVTLINKKIKKRGWEYLKTWVGVFPGRVSLVGIFRVGIFRVGVFLIPLKIIHKKKQKMNGCFSQQILKQNLSLFLRKILICKVSF